MVLYEILLVFITVAFGFALLAESKSRPEKIFYIFFAFIAMIALLGWADIYVGNPSASLQPLSIATNTLYQNSNYSTLYIYATSNSGLKAWLGLNQSQMQMVISDYNNTALLVVPSQWYYKFNFTTGNFIGEYT
ncbi:MAG: hypothetical protein ACP5JY_02725 [Candidatus Nanoarchaeia archaeon]